MLESSEGVVPSIVPLNRVVLDIRAGKLGGDGREIYHLQTKAPSTANDDLIANPQLSIDVLGL
jgi:hypothetical protein